jgi:hypothetical protein
VRKSRRIFVVLFPTDWTPLIHKPAESHALT